MNQKNKNFTKFKSNKEQNLEQNSNKNNIQEKRDPTFEYNNYKDLSIQEIENYKNKYDNRLYTSYRYKLWDNRIRAKDELFLKTRNPQIFTHGKVIKIKIKIKKFKKKF